MMWLVCLLTIIGAPMQAKKDEGQSGIVYGKTFSFMLSAPKGWVLDNNAGTSNGLDAVFYPSGGNWEKRSEVMYTRGVPKHVLGTAGFRKVIQDDVTTFRREHKKPIVSDVGIIRTDSKSKAEVKLYEDKLSGIFEHGRLH